MTRIEDQLIAAGGILIPADPGAGKVLTSDASGGATWQPLTAGSVSKIGDFVLATTTTLRYTAIPQNYTHLMIHLVAQSSRVSVDNTGMRMWFNNVTSNYEYGYRYRNSGNVDTANWQAAQAAGYIGQTPAADRTSDNHISSHIIHIPNYSRLNVIKTYHVDWVAHAGPTALFGNVWGVYTGTALTINRIDITDDFANNLGSRASASLYGVL